MRLAREIRLFTGECDEKNKLVLISYDSSSNLPEGRTWFDLKLEGKGKRM